MFLTIKWQMRTSFPNIFTGWKINQVLSPNETLITFLQAPGACFVGGLLHMDTSEAGVAEFPGRNLV